VVLDSANEGRLNTRRAFSTPVVDLTARPLEPAPPTGEPVDDVIEEMITWTHQNAGTAEVVAAREQYFAAFGKVFPDDTFYDARMAYFFDHFLFERPIAPAAGAGSAMPATPYESFAAKVRDGQDGASAHVAALGGARHSLYRVLKVSERALVVADLITPAKLTATARAGETFRGLEKKALFQGFLYPTPDGMRISHGIIIHPRRVARMIGRYLKRQKKSETFAKRTVLARLAHLQLKYLRHRHVDPKTFYEAELK
jgi:hypothetical protein